MHILHTNNVFFLKNNYFLEQVFSIFLEKVSAIFLFSIFLFRNLKSESLSDRGCYFPDEHPLKVYKEYSQANCILECQERK